MERRRSPFMSLLVGLSPCRHCSARWLHRDCSGLHWVCDDALQVEFCPHHPAGLVVPRRRLDQKPNRRSECDDSWWSARSDLTLSNPYRWLVYPNQRLYCKQYCTYVLPRSWRAFMAIRRNIFTSCILGEGD